MKNAFLSCVLLLLTLPAMAVDGSEVKYAGGTAQDTAAGVTGRLDTTSDSALIFEHDGKKLAIPYDAIESFDYSHEVAHHLGVLPAIANGLFRTRRHRHFFLISYRGQDNVAQVAVFEVPKQMPRSLRAILKARSPGALQPIRPCAANRPS
jgi:hypothetical protein